jgi:hypothetical protein
MISAEKFDAMNDEARALYERVVPFFDNHSSGAIMIVLAQLCANWLGAEDDQTDFNEKVKLFNDIAAATYADLIQTEQGAPH